MIQDSYLEGSHALSGSLAGLQEDPRIEKYDITEQTVVVNNKKPLAE